MVVLRMSSFISFTLFFMITTIFTQLSLQSNRNNSELGRELEKINNVNERLRKIREAFADLNEKRRDYQLLRKRILDNKWKSVDGKKRIKLTDNYLMREKEVLYYETRDRLLRDRSQEVIPLSQEEEDSLRHQPEGIDDHLEDLNQNISAIGKIYEKKLKELDDKYKKLNDIHRAFFDAKKSSIRKNYREGDLEARLRMETLEKEWKEVKGML